MFPEVWADIAPLLQHVGDGRGALWLENSRLPLYRNNQLQERHFTYSYSAVTGEDGSIEGVLDVVTDTTAEVVAGRRLSLLAQLADQLSTAKHPRRIQTVALRLLRRASDDFTQVAFEIIETADGEHTRRLTAVQSQDLLVTDRDGHRTLTARLKADRGLAHGLLTAHVHPQVVVDDAFREFLRLISAGLVQALNRVTAQQVERRNTDQERAMSQALQRSLLTEPAHPDHLQVAVRYQPAAARVFVGGDWHDSFLLPDGRLTVVVGDVTGHDRHAAAAMGQIRNLTRGVAFALRQPPARVLAGVDEAMTGLGIDMFATAVLAQFHPPDPADISGACVMSWSNAGHPAPMLLHPDGSVETLSTSPDTMLGTGLSITRSDHRVSVPLGGTVILHTDGLVERRGQFHDDGVTLLAKTLIGRQMLDAGQLCDLLLTQLGHGTDDDIALAVIRHARADHTE